MSSQPLPCVGEGALAGAWPCGCSGLGPRPPGLTNRHGLDPWAVRLQGVVTKCPWPWWVWAGGLPAPGCSSPHGFWAPICCCPGLFPTLAFFLSSLKLSQPHRAGGLCTSCRCLGRVSLQAHLSQVCSSGSCLGGLPGTALLPPSCSRHLCPVLVSSDQAWHPEVQRLPVYYLFFLH